MHALDVVLHVVAPPEALIAQRASELDLVGVRQQVAPHVVEAREALLALGALDPEVRDIVHGGHVAAQLVAVREAAVALRAVHGVDAAVHVLMLHLALVRRERLATDGAAEHRPREQNRRHLQRTTGRPRIKFQKDFKSL